MSKNLVRLATIVMASLLLGACHSSPADKLAEETATPTQAVEHALGDIEAGHFDRLHQHLLPPAAYQTWRGDWTALRERQLASVTPTDRARFAKLMQDVTEPGAKAKLAAKLKPTLDDWAKGGKQKLPMMVGVFKLILSTKITGSKVLTGPQQVEAMGVVDALGNWVQQTDWGDQDKAKKAIGITVDTARKLDLKDLDAVYKLSYADTNARYATLWHGFNQLADVYGLPVMDMLSAAKVKVTDENKAKDQATVEVKTNFLKAPVTVHLDMVKQGQRWYPAKAIAYAHKLHQKVAQASSTAPASSAPARAASVSPAPAASAP